MSRAARHPITVDAITRARGGDRDAIWELCLGMQGIIKTMALKFAANNSSIDIDDLIQIGYLSVMKAAKKYLFGFGTTFSSYATKAILNDFRDEVTGSDKIRAAEAGTEQEALERFVDHRTEHTEVDADLFGRIDPAEAAVVLARLEPLATGGSPLPWKQVAKAVGMPEAMCIEVFERAMGRIER